MKKRTDQKPMPAEYTDEEFEALLARAARSYPCDLETLVRDVRAELDRKRLWLWLRETSRDCKAAALRLLRKLR